MTGLAAGVRLALGMGLAFGLLTLVGALPATANTTGTGLVISQVYGAGGNSGATYNSDYVELFNPTAAPISLNGWSIQYASAAGTGNFGASTTQLTELPNVSIPAGKYYLVGEAGGATGLPVTADLADPTPIPMAAAAGKVALVNTATTLGCNGSSTLCSAGQLAQIVDLVGYGTGASGANFFEGAGPAPTIGAALSDFRANDGCTDTDNNAADFTAAPPSPRNLASAPKTCAAPASLTINDVSQSEGNSGTTTFTFTVSLSKPAPAPVTFDIATGDGTATSASGDYVAKSLIGQAIGTGNSTYTFSVTANGDPATEPDERFAGNVTNVVGADVGDGQGRGTIVSDDVCGLPFTPISTIQGSGSS